mmetsp:Transcript_22083/g.39325  ORF Transcript_22083/g.39325 Transcript_22083/m.39325 type:complete len:215 (+) Transcript_22083:1542-2186(+)
MSASPPAFRSLFCRFPSLIISSSSSSIFFFPCVFISFSFVFLLSFLLFSLSFFLFSFSFFFFSLSFLLFSLSCLFVSCSVSLARLSCSLSTSRFLRASTRCSLLRRSFSSLRSRLFTSGLSLSPPPPSSLGPQRKDTACSFWPVTAAAKSPRKTAAKRASAKGWGPRSLAALTASARLVTERASVKTDPPFLARRRPPPVKLDPETPDPSGRWG